MPETVPAPDAEIIDDAHAAIMTAGASAQQATDVISELQNAGMLLRRRES